MARWTWPAGYECPYLAPLVRFLVHDPSAAVRPPSAGAVPVAAPGAALRTAAPRTPLPLITSWRLPQTVWPARVTPGWPARVITGRPRAEQWGCTAPFCAMAPCPAARQSPCAQAFCTVRHTRVYLGGTVNGECRRGLRCSTSVCSEFVVLCYSHSIHWIEWLVPLRYSSEQLLMVPTVFGESKNSVYLKGDVIWICQCCCLWKTTCFHVILHIKIPGVCLLTS